MRWQPATAAEGGGWRTTGRLDHSPQKAKKPLSSLNIGCELLLDFLRGQGAAENLPIDEESRGRIDAELHCAGAAFLDSLEHLLIRETFVEALLGEARLSGNVQHRLQRLLHHPVLLLQEQRLDQREILILAGATRQHGTGGGKRVQRELAEDEADLAGIDVFPFQF